MRLCKLTKNDLAELRKTERDSFPAGNDESIINLSRPPYYTACPNPYIEEFVKENGTPYNEATDDYHREPFAADVSEGKNDPIYNAHSYHTKVPHKAIMRYILHYTKPGDIVFDGFCGTGMTGVAAQMCGSPSYEFKNQIENEMPSVEWGIRKTILNDLSPIATYISYLFNSGKDKNEYAMAVQLLLKLTYEKMLWLFKTKHTGTAKQLSMVDDYGIINYVLWSDVYICPSCASEIVYWDVAIDRENGVERKTFTCPHCKSTLKKTDMERATQTYFDHLINDTLTVAKCVPVLINYTYRGHRYEKEPDAFDIENNEKINNLSFEHPLKTIPLPVGFNTEQPKRSHGVLYTHQMYTKRSQLFLSELSHQIAESGKNEYWAIITSVANRNLTRCNRFVINSHNPRGRVNGPLQGTLYIPSITVEQNPYELMSYKLKDVANMFVSSFNYYNVCITTESLTNMQRIPDNSIDYVFTDPPFGGNINYSEMNCLNEAILSVSTNATDEAIVNETVKKTEKTYERLMTEAFSVYYRALKPGRWITIEFHNSRNSIWNIIQNALLKCGFVVADTRVLDKQHPSQAQLNNPAAVKQDLVISAYKPRESFIKQFKQHAGDPEMVWEFVRQHLRNVPVTADGNHDGKLDVIAERQNFLLFDRMVAWHIMNGIPVPMDAHTFYEGLRQRFLVRDGMFFLPDQVNEYDDKRAHMELDVLEMELVPIDEKSSIAWLNMKLSQGPMTYQQIQPLYMQELHQSSQEKMPELLDMLKENFIQDEKGAWYVPDLTNAADLAKVRRKALLKEFWDSCATGKGKLKVFRMEAIRAGFDECWKLRDYKTIVSVGERLPEAVLQEDPALLMYYDNACSRV